MRPEPYDIARDRQAVEERETAIQQKAEEIAEKSYGREFNDLPPTLQYRVWQDAEIALDGKRDTPWDELELMRRLGK